MLSSVTQTNILHFVEKVIIKSINDSVELLHEGDLYSFEKQVNDLVMKFHEFLMEKILCKIGKQIAKKLKKEYEKSSEFGNIKKRKMTIRLSTGKRIKLLNWYLGKVPKNWKGTRHVLGIHWKIFNQGSPLLYDKVSYCVALGPSYDVANQTLSKFGVNISLSSVRDISNRFAKYCYKQGEENILLRKEETVKEKIVIISVDGGRTNTRKNKEELNKYGNIAYIAKWKEPKLFVIDIIDKETGKLDSKALPIYGTRFGKNDMTKLLKKYLKKLNIQDAEAVQIIADGAKWIWNKVPSEVQNSGVTEEKIIETLDYYHAVNYVNKLVEHMPSKLTEQDKLEHLKNFKKWLWEGQSDKIVTACQTIYKRKSKLVKRWIKYLSKHQPRTQYADFEESNLMCGSGIVESAIRRIINLRFKNASTFWKIGQVEKLYFLRGALLSKRWDLVFNNIYSCSMGENRDK